LFVCLQASAETFFFSWPRFSASDASVVDAARARFEALCAEPASGTACPSDFRVAVFKIVLKAAKDGLHNQLTVRSDLFTNQTPVCWFYF
jgi:hypothetical protein